MLIGCLGGIVLLAGLVMIPYPGPGWLVVFAGLAILATEFTFAERLLVYGRRRYEAWSVWLKRQHIAVQLLVLALTGLVVVATVWLLNGFGFIRLYLLPLTGIRDDWLWLDSPLF